MKPVLLFTCVLLIGAHCAYATSGLGEPLLFFKDPEARSGVHFRAKSGALSATFQKTEIVLRKQAAEVHIRFLGANPAVQLEARGNAEGRVNFIQGEAPLHWWTGLPVFNGVVYRQLYPGIDMVYKNSKGCLKSEYLVAPGADPSAIRLHYSGPGETHLDDAGNLVWRASTGEFREQAPEVFQEIDGRVIPVEGAFRILPEGSVGFRIGSYDHTWPLVIDPGFSFSTYLGGSGMDSATGIAIDSDGYIYVTGWTDSSDFPVVDAAQPVQAGNVDVFVAKWAPGGSRLVYCTYLGGSGEDRGYALATGLSGDVYVTGLTGSTNFPVAAALQSSLVGYRNAFIARLDSLGCLIFGTYLGGNGSDSGYGIAVDGSGNVYVAGQTSSFNFPVLNAYQNTNHGQSDAFVTKLYAAGSLAYSTYLGGSGADGAQAIAVDASGNAYITGSTSSTDFPVFSALQPSSGGTQDAFVTKLDASGQFLAYSTYLGGSGGAVYPQIGHGIAVDQEGEAYVAGVTNSSNFPVCGALQPYFANGGTDAFLSKLNASGTGFVYSTYLGGSSLDYATSVAVDSAGNAYVGGYTASTDFPLLNAPQPVQAGAYDGFVAKVSPAGTLLESTYLGGSGIDSVNAIAVGHPDMVFIAGQTQSLNFPLENASQIAPGGSIDAFAAILALIPRDFDWSGKPDLLLQNNSSNQLSIWFMGGPLGSTLLSSPIFATPLPGWRVVAANDFNGDGAPDLILQNAQTNQVSIWYMGGSQGITMLSAPIFATATPGWNVMAAADFDGDGYTDLLLQNTQTNQLSIWFMVGSGGTTIMSWPILGVLPPGWTTVAVADFDGDGCPDLVIQNQQTNEIQIWFLAVTRDSLSVKSVFSLGHAAPGWYVVGSGDFDSNGCPDLVLENDSMNAISFWYMGGGQCTVRMDAPIVSFKVNGWDIVGAR